MNNKRFFEIYFNDDRVSTSKEYENPLTIGEITEIIKNSYLTEDKEFIALFYKNEEGIWEEVKTYEIIELQNIIIRRYIEEYPELTIL